MTEKLLPCPFCGGTPTVQDYRETSDQTGEVDGYAAVECYHGGGSNTAVLFHCDTLEEAINLWNTRPFSPGTIIAGVAAQVLASLPAPQTNLAGSMKHVGWRWKHPDTPDEGHWHYEGGVEKPDPGFTPNYAEKVIFEKVFASTDPSPQPNVEGKP